MPRDGPGSRPDPDAAPVGGGRLPREARLSRARDYARVFEAPRSSRGRAFTVLARENDLPLARLGLAIARKHLRRAVARNTVKRLVRESFRSHRETLAGLDVVVLARAGIDPADRAALRRELARHWRRLGGGR